MEPSLRKGARSVSLAKREAPSYRHPRIIFGLTLGCGRMRRLPADWRQCGCCQPATEAEQIKAYRPKLFPNEGIPRLGKVSDSDLARNEVAPQTVNNQRRKQRHPKFKPEPAKLQTLAKNLLGKVSDVELGKRANHKRCAISIMRKEAGFHQTRPWCWTPLD